MPEYIPPASSAVNFNDENEAYVAPGSTVVNFNDTAVLNLYPVGIDSTESFGTPTVRLQKFYTPTGPDPVIVQGGYDSVHQRTDVYAAPATNGERVSYRWQPSSNRITADRPADNDDIDRRDKQDILDIFTAFRLLRKAA